MVETKKNDDNMMAALAYLLGILTGIVVYVMYKDKVNKFVLFNAVQSIILNVALFVIFFAVGIVGAILTMIPYLGWVIGLVMMLIWLVVMVGMFCLWIFLMYKAFNGVKYSLPVIGPLADKYA